jgi:site-specific recombinase XerD
MKLREFELQMKQKGLADNTVRSYLHTINYFISNYELSIEDILEYKGYLIENHKPRTVNLRIQALNKYLKFLGREDLKLTAIKLQQKHFLENVISQADYVYLKKRLKKDHNLKWHFIVWYLGATGARVSELTHIKVEHVFLGHFDIYSKGGKMRRLIIPKRLQKSTISWLEYEGRHTGFLFLNRYAQPLSTRGIAHQLKQYARKYNLNTQVVYPHSFRHMFAKCFLQKHNDISLLADLMGHESIETTRIYLRKTATEQKEIVNKVVTW